MKISYETFNILIQSIKKCYAKDVEIYLPNTENFPPEVFNGNEVDLELLLNRISNLNDPYLKSLSLRIIAMAELRNARDKKHKLNIGRVWKFIFESILIIPIEATISSIGSQGFLSIPLFKYDTIKEEFDFIRLHIWHNSLEDFIDTDKCEKFSIHTHTFYAQSWILCGKVLNEQFLVKSEPNNHTMYSLFKVGYNKSLNEVNKHVSIAENMYVNVNVKQISREIYMQGASYSINAGDYHKSSSKAKDGLSATLFSFTAKNGLANHSYVIGPKDVSNSEINRKVMIDPRSLLIKIDKELKKL